MESYRHQSAILMPPHFPVPQNQTKEKERIYTFCPGGITSKTKKLSTMLETPIAPGGKKKGGGVTHITFSLKKKKHELPEEEEENLF